jgi:hypothetical protein
LVDGIKNLGLKAAAIDRAPMSFASSRVRVADDRYVMLSLLPEGAAQLLESRSVEGMAVPRQDADEAARKHMSTRIRFGTHSP